MKVWAIKARWIKACFVSNKTYEVTITKLSVIQYWFMLAIRLWLLKQCLHHNIAEKINKNLQKQERIKMKRCVGMACQNVHKQGRI